jgi:uncharacterized membrane protein
MRGFLNKTDYRHFAIYTAILLPVAVLCYQGSLSLGNIPPAVLFGILLLMPVAGNLEIPVGNFRTRKPDHLQRDALLLENIYAVPVVKELSGGSRIIFDTVVTINLGGFVIPVITAAYLLASRPDFVALEILLIVMVIVALLSETIDGVGIVVPDYAGIIALPFALLLEPANGDVILFTAGTMGILAGVLARFITFDRERNGSAYINIGGAGSFRSIYVTALLAALVSYFV